MEMITHKQILLSGSWLLCESGDCTPVFWELVGQDLLPLDPSLAMRRSSPQGIAIGQQHAPCQPAHDHDQPNRPQCVVRTTFAPLITDPWHRSSASQTLPGTQDPERGMHARSGRRCLRG